MNKVIVKFLKLHPDAVIPEYQTNGSSGMDISAYLSEPLELKPMERRLIPTGLKMELPEGYEAQVRPRSGMSIKHGITLINCVGTIDEDYRGEICVPVVNLSNETYTINNRDRIAQMIISPVTKAIAQEIKEELSVTSRGSGGFGSTGYSAQTVSE